MVVWRGDFHAERIASVKALTGAKLSVCANKVEVEGAGLEQITRSLKSPDSGNGLSEPV